jgi:hypothetical protein
MPKAAEILFLRHGGLKEVAVPAVLALQKIATGYMHRTWAARLHEREEGEINLREASGQTDAECMCQ